MKSLMNAADKLCNFQGNRSNMNSHWTHKIALENYIVSDCSLLHVSENKIICS